MTVLNRLRFNHPVREVEDQILAETHARAAAYQVLDQVLANNCVLPGVRGVMFCVIDSLRSVAAPAEDVRRAEAISIGIQKFEWARQQGDVTAANAAIDGLKVLAAEWLNSRICGSR